MDFLNRMKEPVFLKESNTAEIQLENLRKLEPLLTPEGQSIIRQDIKCLEYGIIGEKNIAFELKNSHMPIYILHDLYLEDGDLSAQIDYLVITRKIAIVIECKNLYGNIEINSAGDFIRTMNFGGKQKKEGIYSPITQNQHHLELLKKIKIDKRKNIVSKMMAERYFDDFNKSVVVLANPKTVLNAKYAKKEIKEKVIRSDQLVKYIKDLHDKSKEIAESDRGLLEVAQSYLALHKEVEKDYTAKYERYRIKGEEAEAITQNANALKTHAVNGNKEEGEIPIEESDIYKELQKYRWEKSREEGIKPYFICNNSQLKDLIAKMPKDLEELKKVDGFGEVKTGKYGNDLLKILEKYKVDARGCSKKSN
ncbi:HRDC domain-containing protein [Clostridium sp. AM58-1XD]|uniref:HRDC domain-containing protein n=1 Tax=Clostridium sp. AM58-1XD TaxID=2292307 RepID=UPI000E519E65|nr:HRDC domain-containing protein [Clostridium sp. AM58-1XD]RGY98749.1 helicase [Clostridium sp. AM58-1XD]